MQRATEISVSCGSSQAVFKKVAHKKLKDQQLQESVWSLLSLLCLCILILASLEGCLSQEAMWKWHSITVNFKKRGVKPEERTWLIQEYLIRLSQKESHTAYLIWLQSHRDLTPQLVMEILPGLKLIRTYWYTAGGFGDILYTNQNWEEPALPLCINLWDLFYACSCFFFSLVSFFFSFFFPSSFEMLSEKSDLSAF